MTSPRVFAPGVISTGDYESHPAFSPTGDTLFFFKCAPDFSTWTICVSYFKNETWTSPEVASFSGQYMDADPFFTKDGRTLYFISNRPLHEGDSAKIDMDIWKIELAKRGWSNLIHLEAPINSSADEYYPTIADNETMYFGSERSGGKGGSDIYRSRLINGTDSAVENLGDSINTADNEYEPFIAPDESYLIFMATRPNGLKNGDLYMSRNQNGNWTKGLKLQPPVNSTGTEWSPKVTRDGKYFFFGSTRNTFDVVHHPKELTADFIKRLRAPGNGLGDIYQVDFLTLKTIPEESVSNTNSMMDDKAALSALNAQFIKNFLHNDSAAHEQIIHKDFVCIENSGEIVGRDQYMKDWARDYDSSGYITFNYTEEFIRIFGTVALVRSKTMYTKNENGKIIKGYSVYTDTYLKENGKWLCVQAQITPVKTR